MQPPSLSLCDWRHQITPLASTHHNRFDDTALWFCTSHITHQTTAIHGGLAQVLMAYPQHFHLALFSAPSQPQETVL